MTAFKHESNLHPMVQLQTQLRRLDTHSKEYHRLQLLLEFFKKADIADFKLPINPTPDSKVKFNTLLIRVNELTSADPITLSQITTCQKAASQYVKGLLSNNINPLYHKNSLK